MIANYKCDDCRIASVCQAKSKLKPFSDEAKTDLGVILTMTECSNYLRQLNEDSDIEEEIED